jgi:hypothetical protein
MSAARRHVPVIQLLAIARSRRSILRRFIPRQFSNHRLAPASAWGNGQKKAGMTIQTSCLVQKDIL